MNDLAIFIKALNKMLIEINKVEKNFNILYRL